MLRSLFFILFTLLLGVTPSLAANGAEFKISVPSYWKRSSLAFDGVAFINTRSQINQVIVIRSLPLPSGDKMKPAELLSLQKEMTAERARQLVALGIGGYHTQSFELKSNILAMESRYVGITRKETQVVERHIFTEGRIFQIVYSEESPGLGDRQRISYLLDAFQPRLDRRSAAAELLFPSADASETKSGGPPTSPVDAAVPEKKPAPMSSEELKACESVVKDESKRRTAADPAFMEAKGIKMAQGCLGGVGSFAAETATGIGNLLLNYSGPALAYKEYKYVTDPVYRAETNASALAAAEAAKHPVETGTKLVQKMASYVETHQKEFKCLKPLQQWSIVCKSLSEGAALVATAGAIGVGVKSALEAQKAAKLAKIVETATQAELAGAKTAVAAADKSAKASEVSGAAKPRLTEAEDRIATSSKAQESLGADKAAQHEEAIFKSHKVGEGELGRDGVRPAGVGNYTNAQLRAKSKILRDDGVSIADRRKLVEDKVVGAEWELDPNKASAAKLVVTNAEELKGLSPHVKNAETSLAKGDVAGAKNSFFEAGREFKKSGQLAEARENLSRAERFDDYRDLVTSKEAIKSEWTRVSEVQAKKFPDKPDVAYYQEQVSAARTQLELSYTEEGEAMFGRGVDPFTAQSALEKKIEKLEASLRAAKK